LEDDKDIRILILELESYLRTCARIVRIGCISTLVLFAGLVTAAESELSHLHAALPVSGHLTVRSVLETTIENYPAGAELDARIAEAAAWGARGRRWLSASPALSFRYQSDQWGDDNGLEEMESGIEFPIWRWGERAAVRSLGESMNAEAGNAAMALRWQVAGVLRATLWDIALADNNFVLAEEAFQVSSRLAMLVERRHALGDVALSDVLLAQTAVLEAQTQLTDARAAILDAERGYRNLTTLDHRPPFEDEAQSSLLGIEPDHPALVFANAELRRADARQKMLRRSSAGAPSLLIGPRRERTAFEQSFADSIGITLRVPFGGMEHRQTVVAAAGRETASIRAARNQLVRQLDLQLHEAAHQLVVIRENLSTARQRSALAERLFGMAQIAYENGEYEIIDLLKIQSAALAAKRQVTGLVIEEMRQTSLYNQAVGELP